MESIQTFEIHRSELEITEVTAGEENLYLLVGLFVASNGDFAGWIVERQRPGRGEGEIFCERRPGNETIEVIHCGGPQVVKKRAILTTERVLSLFSGLAQGLNADDYNIMLLHEVFAGL
jgi:hypothetical protein